MRSLLLTAVFTVATLALVLPATSRSTEETLPTVPTVNVVAAQSNVADSQVVEAINWRETASKPTVVRRR